jgi:hypothetical protein
MGSGYRVFTAGEVLTASNVQNYLQDQAVMVFAGTAARTSAIGTANFEEGMLTYLTDVDKLQVYTGSSFADVYPPAATSQGLTLINTTSFSGVSAVNLPADTFTTTYDNYRYMLNAVPSTSNRAQFRLRASGTDETSANYDLNFTTASSLNQTLFDFNGTARSAALCQIVDFFAPKKSAFTLVLSSNFLTDNAGNPYMQSGGGILKLTTAYDSFSIIASTGTLTGTISVFGYAK